MVYTSSTTCRPAEARVLVTCVAGAGTGWNGGAGLAPQMNASQIIDTPAGNGLGVGLRKRIRWQP